MAVRDGDIVFIGSNQAATRYIGPGTKVVNAKGNMVMPSFSDAHAHAGMTVASLYAVSLWFLPTVEDYVATVAEFAAANPDLEWIRGEGWSNTVVPGIGPLASDLDAVVSDRPVAITSEDYHSLWVNSKTLEIAEIDEYTPDPVGGVIERIPGTADPANGTTASPRAPCASRPPTMVQAIIPDYTLAQYKEGILAYQDWIARPYGITPGLRPAAHGRRPRRHRRTRSSPRRAC